MFERILIATDASEPSERAARAGIDLARVAGAKITAVYVIDQGKFSAAVPSVSWNIADKVVTGIRKSLRSEGEAAVKKVEDMAREAGVPADSKIIEGHPADDILRLSQETPADLIVVGSIGKTGIERFLLGSVAEKIVRHSTVPVLVVRGKAGERTA